MLEEERNTASFDKKQLAYVIYGSSEELDIFIKSQKVISDDQVLRFDPKHIHNSRKENMLVHAKKLIRHHEIYDFDYRMKGKQSTFFSEQMPLSLHFYMFLITLNNLCTEKQLKLFYQPAVKGQILGCYAQTQLSHGSDIQNLSTTATYDEETQTFIMHSNGIGATKWWIGDLGTYANHAAIFAQLIIKNKKYGLHTFLVPIRDKDHKPFPGVQVGDIGPKYGYNTKDNGYIRFEQYRIPRRNMLMKYTKVSKSGVYERRGNQKISYATMLMIRSAIPIGCFYGLSKACTIGVRYSIYRTQFKNEKGKQIKILDYQLQQDKIFSRLAEMFAIMFGSKSISELSKEVFETAKQKNQFTRLNQAHSLASGIKAVFTNDTLRGLQIIRRSLGGHGFSMYSGIPGLIAQLAPTPTFQGENSILFLQTARFLLKALKYISKGKPLPPTVQYLHQMDREEPFVADLKTIEQAMSPQYMRKIFLFHSCECLKKAAGKMQEGIGEGMNPKQVWDTKAGIRLSESGLAHTNFWIFETFYMKIYSSTKNEKLRKVLVDLLLLYGINKITQLSSSYFETGVITDNTIKTFLSLKEVLFKRIRPEALTLVEAFHYDDNILHSAIGGAHEKPYQTLIDWAKNKNVMNTEKVRKQIIEEWNKSKALMIPKM